jgi:hypothetical protein
MTHRSLVVLGWVILGGFSATDAAAQAWLPPKGEGAVSVLYQNLFTREHFLAGGGRIDRGHIQSNNLLFDVTFGLTDKMALTLAAPFIRTQYTGTFPHPRPEDLLGETNSGFQNLRFGLRYNIVDNEAVTITPFVGTSVPSHSYEYFAHAALGTRVRELEVGSYVARTLGPALPRAFVQARYGYSFAERIENIHHDRSSLDVEIGYVITPAVRVFAVSTGQKTHGGIDTPDAGWKAMDPILAPHHDRLARLEMLDFGGGVQVSVTRSLDVFGSFMKTTAGRNSHALARGLTVGASWSFGGGMPPLAASASTDAEPKQVLVRCLCQK